MESDTSSEDEYEKLEREHNRLKELIKDYVTIVYCDECHQMDIVENENTFWCYECHQTYHFNCRKNCQSCDCCDGCRLIDNYRYRYCSRCR